LQAELEATPEPPQDLWERMDQARRNSRNGATKPHPLSQPDLTSLAFPEITPARKTYPIRVVERLDSVPDVRPAPRKTYKLKGDI